MPLNTKRLSEVETSQPVIEAGMYHARCKAELKENNAKDGMLLVINYELLDTPNNKETGEPVTRPIKLTSYTSLKATEKYDPNENLRRIADALGHDPEQDLEVEDIQDAVLKVRVSVQPPRPKKDREGNDTGETWPEGNQVQGWQIKDDDFITEGI